MAGRTRFSFDPYVTPDIEQVQNEKTPFTLRCMLCRTTPHEAGEVHRWNRSTLSAWTT